MRKILSSLYVIVIIVGYSFLSGCSSSGDTSGGLGLDLSGQWRGDLTDRRYQTSAGDITFLLQYTSASLSPTTSIESTVFGTFSYVNYLDDVCPISSIIGTFTGTIVGNKVVFASDEAGDFFLNVSAIANNQQMAGEWNMHFEYTITDGAGDTATSTTFACNLFGPWNGVKTAS